MARVEWAEGAVIDLRSLDRPIATRILTKISWLAEHIDTLTPEPLSGNLQGMYKLRVGDWRVAYTTEGDLVVIQAIGHRSEIYR